MIDSRPGLNTPRLLRLMRTAVARCRLDLTSAVVLTEAASGAYVVTPVLAALAGAAKVFALTRATRYGSVEEITAYTMEVARLAGVDRQIDIVTAKSREIVAQADIVTNCGHLRPIDAAMVDWMKPTAVIPLMYEEWELRPHDVDVAACGRRGVLLAGTDERDPSVDVFSYLGIMAVKLLLDAGVAVYGCRVLVLCDNPFGPFLERGLAGAGAVVETRTALEEAHESGDFDTVLVALQPRGAVRVGAAEAYEIARRWPGAVVAQCWGDIDRAALGAAQVPVWPVDEPGRGHMGILLSAVGPDAVVRLQTEGLKVGERLWRSRLCPQLR